MNRLVTNLILCISVSQSVLAGTVDYTNRKNTQVACELFARDAYQASDNFNDGMELGELLKVINKAPVSDSQKQRAYQAIKFVWTNHLENPVLASTLAMGLCLKPRQAMAPLDEPWIHSPRTSREYF